MAQVHSEWYGRGEVLSFAPGEQKLCDFPIGSVAVGNTKDSRFIAVPQRTHTPPSCIRAGIPKRNLEAWMSPAES